MNHRRYIVVSKNTTLDGCEAIGNGGLYYKYTLLLDINGVENEIKEEIRQNSIELYKTHPDTKTLRNTGIILKYSYSDELGKELFEFSVDPKIDFE